MLRGHGGADYGSLAGLPLVPRERILLSSSLIEDFRFSRPPPPPASAAFVSPEAYVYFYFRLNHASWRVGVRSLAVFSLFLSSFFETLPSNVDISVALSFIGGLVLLLDIALRWRYLSIDPRSDSIATLTFLVVFCHLLEISMLLSLCPSVLSDAPIFLTSIAKPITVIWVYPRSRFALQTFRGVALPTLKIICVYLLIVLVYAVCATYLYSRDSQFSDVSTSWVTLFTLSTSVNNPSCWMPLYKESKSSALFFISFLLVTFFAVKNLVIAVSVNLYHQCEQRLDRSLNENRTSSLAEAFNVLKTSSPSSPSYSSSVSNHIRRSDLLTALLIVRSKYSLRDIERMYSSACAAASVTLFTSRLEDELVDFETFRKTVPLFLQFSIQRPTTFRYYPFAVTAASEFFHSAWTVLKNCGGQLALVCCCAHILVYVGMASWRPLPVVVPSASSSPSSSLYYLNSFDSYGEGLVTVFNIVVVNDWQMIAEVYLDVSTRTQVYAFFIVANLLLSLILTNLLTAFFVSSFMAAKNNAEQKQKQVTTDEGIYRRDLS